MGTDHRVRPLLFVLAVGCGATAVGCGPQGAGVERDGGSPADLSAGALGGSGGGNAGTGGSAAGTGGSAVATGGAPGSGGLDAGAPPDVGGGVDQPRPDGGQGGTGGGRTCNGLPAGTQPPFMPVYRIPMQLHRTRSDIGDEQLCRVLEEVNEIWWKQAGICFEIVAVKPDAPAARTGLDFWFERSTPFPNGVTANGVYGGPHEIYGQDKPGLARAPNPVRELAARTCAHELGHALTLGHQNPGEACLFQGTECDDLLMRSGHNGYKVISGSPANVNELTRARAGAQKLTLQPTDAIVCAPPRILP